VSLELHGHLFSSYTWKALIALYETDTPFTFRNIAGNDHPDNEAAFLAHWPVGKFPLLVEDGVPIMESSIIVEHVAPAMVPDDHELIGGARPRDASRHCPNRPHLVVVPHAQMATIPLWAYGALAGVVTVVLIVLLVSRRGGGTDSLQQGVDAYVRGQREVAVNAFNKAARENAKSALPHVYLARMAREVGNLTLASQELQLALEAEPANAIALREMGANLLTQGNYELARRFYVRAVQADPNDKTAQGYLGCTLMRLNRASEATSFLNRAGPGPWSNCTPVAPAAANGVVRP